MNDPNRKVKTNLINHSEDHKFDNIQMKKHTYIINSTTTRSKTSHVGKQKTITF